MIGRSRRFCGHLVLVSLLLGGLPALADDPAETEKPVTLHAVPIGAPPPIPVEALFRRHGGSDYRIGRQDLLEITVFDVEELSQTVRVADDGSITMPLLGTLDVSGLTKTELEQSIARLLAERYVRNPQVTVFVKEYTSKQIAVSGAVKKPGTY